MLPGYPGHNTRAAQPKRNSPGRAQRPRCCCPTTTTKGPMRTFPKEPRPSRTGRRRGINISGVDFWHAVEFSRNGRFLRPLFTGPPGASLRCFQPYQTLFRTVSGPNSNPMAVERPSPFGCSDFIRFPRVEFPRPARAHRHTGVPGTSLWRSRKRTGRPRPEANRLPRGRPAMLTRRQTSTTTGRIMGLRR